MAIYKCKRPFWFNGRLYKAGDEVDYPGFPSDNLEPVDAAGRQKVAAYASHRARVAAEKAAAANAEGRLIAAGQMEAMGPAIAAAVAKAVAEQVNAALAAREEMAKGGGKTAA